MQVSVIIPAYNATATLAETLMSVKMQTVKPFETIVVDDGSTDDTGRLAKQFGARVVTCTKNQGVGAALDEGLAESVGSVVAFLDSDDLWTQTKLEVQLAELLNRDADAVVGGVQEFVCPSLSPEEATRLRARPEQTGWLYGSTLLRRSAFDGLPFRRLRTGVWIDWVARAKQAGRKFHVQPDLVLLRRLRPGTLSTSESRVSDLFEIIRSRHA